MPKRVLTNEQIIDNLRMIFDGETLETLKGVLMEPDGELSPGYVARVSAAFGAFANKLDGAVKASVLPLIEGQSGEQAKYANKGVEFQYVPPSVARVFDARAMETTLQVHHGIDLSITPDDLPEAYKESKRRAYVRVSFPE